MSIEANYVLETAYMNGETQVEWKDGALTHNMTLDFKTETGTGATGEIKRTSEYFKYYTV